MRDLHSHVEAVDAITPAVRATSNTPVTVDLQGYDGAEILLQVGVGGITFSAANKIEFTLEHSDDDTTYEAVAASDVLGVSTVSGGILKALTAEHAAASAYRFGYVGGRRYLQLTAVFSGTHGTGTPMAAAVLKAFALSAPVADQA